MYVIVDLINIHSEVLTCGSSSTLDLKTEIMSRMGTLILNDHITSGAKTVGRTFAKFGTWGKDVNKQIVLHLRPVSGSNCFYPGCRFHTKLMPISCEN